MRASRAATSAILGLALAAGTLCQIHPVGAAGVLLRYKFVLGQTTHYQVSLRLTGSIDLGVVQKLNIAQQMSYTQKVAKLYPDGSADIVSSFGKGTTTTNGVSAPLDPGLAVTTERLSPNGAVLGSKTSGAAAPAASGLGNVSVSPTTVTPTFPSLPVSTGSTWSGAQSISVSGFSIVGKQSSKVVSLSQQGGHQVALIASTAKAPLSVTQSSAQITGTLKGTTATQFDADAGLLVSIHGNVAVVATLGVPGATPDPSTTAQAGGITLNEKIDIVRQK